MHRYIPLVLLGLNACVMSSGRGPYLGACAEYPEGVYTYGEVGIGTCLSGPVDLALAQFDGRQMLVVANADPFHNYTGGSVMLLDQANVRPGQGRVLIDDLDPVVIDAPTFIGAVGIDAARERVIVADRISPEGVRTEEPDRVWLLDATSPDTPVWDERPFITVRQDPLAIEVVGDRAYVLNATDTSISVIDLAANPPGLLDPAPESLVVAQRFVDVDRSGSSAELRVSVLGSSLVTTTDVWSLRRVPGTTRAWVPTPARVDDGGEPRTGLLAWLDGGSGYAPDGGGAGIDGAGVDIDPADGAGLTHLDDAWIIALPDRLQALFSANGRISSADAVGAGDWAISTRTVLQGNSDWNAVVGGPSLAALTDRSWLFFDGRADAAVEDGAIGVATTTDGATYVARADAIIEPGTWVGLAQPDVLRDPNADHLRMYLSVWDGTRWQIALSESDAPDSGWSTPEVVLGSPAGSVGAPWVTWAEGRYQMWLTRSTDTGWEHASAWSWDGIAWSEPVVIIPSDVDDADPRPGVVTGAPARPPRVGVQVAPEGVWRVTGASRGPIESTSREGEILAMVSDGLQLQVASGHRIGTDLAGDLSAGGVEVNAWANTQGTSTLYATLVDNTGVRRVAALRQLGDRWGTAAADLVPQGTGGNVAGVRAPVVYEAEGSWHMIYAADDGFGAWTMRHASSPDGLNFTPTARRVLTDAEGWSSVEQLPHQVEAVEGGWRLWYAGSDGQRFRIGSAFSADGTVWSAEPGDADGWVIGTGEPGTFDDSGVADPVFLTCGGARSVFYSAFDGDIWSIGQATEVDGVWERRLAPLEQEPSAALAALPGTFAALGVRRPVFLLDDGYSCDGPLHAWFSGTDGTSDRAGDAIVHGDTLFPAVRFATAADTLGFVTRKGETGTSAIDLGQVIDNLVLPGTSSLVSLGPSSMWHDAERGFLYVVSRLSGVVIVVDIRDDSTATWDDLNYLDIEQVLRLQASTKVIGYYDIVSAHDRLYLSAREPDALYVLDIGDIPDDATREVVERQALTTLPVHDLNDDAGEPTQAGIGAAGLAWVPGQDLLLMTHLRDNSLSVFDLTQGVAGAEIAWLPAICESPDTIVVARNGLSAVIACYVGSVWRGEVSSQLLVLDLDPSSPTYLQITTTVVNE